MKSRAIRAALVFAFAAAGLIASAGVARAESRIEKTLKLEPGGTFTLRTDVGAVRIKGTAQPGARVVVTSKRDDLDDILRFEWSEGAGSVSVTAKKKHQLSSFFGSNNYRVTFEVEVPTKTRVTVDTSGGSIVLRSLEGEAKLETSGGSIDVEDHTADVAAHTSGGEITLARIQGKAKIDTSGGGIHAREISGALDAETSGGSIDLDDVKGDIHAHTSGGGIEIREAGGRVDADTSGGSVETRFARGNAKGGTIESSGGGVSVAVDPSVGLSIDASGNSVHSDIPVTVHGDISRHHLQGKLNSGGETLRVRTSGGSVRIKSI
jgi:DUF4097 and DUF4098 domain-containing protein YvlB